MIRRWGHGHTWAAGLLAGVVLAEHAWWALAAAFTLGLAAGRFWGVWRGAVRLLRLRAGAPR